MKMYTAQEMRDAAIQILLTDDDWYDDAVHRGECSPLQG